MSKNDWIPCSERLPEIPKNSFDTKNYLVCCESGVIMTFRWCDGWNCHYNLNDGINREFEVDDVIAWMPLPEPYKEGDE